MNKKFCLLILFSFLLFNSSACSNGALKSSPANPAPAGTSQEAQNEEQPVAASNTETPQSNATPAAVHTITPAAPGAPEESKQDIDTSSTANRKLALGDSFRLGIFERPFTAGDMNYVEYTDLQEASISSDENFFYFVLDLENNGIDADHPGMHYGVEFDTDLDGRGDILLWAQESGNPDWTTDGVSVFEDANEDVGGSKPVMADPSRGDGYESLLFSPQQTGDPDSAWRRSDGRQIHLAVKKGLIGSSGFFWKVWADNGPADPSLFDYNDSFSEAQAGSPGNGSSAFYPVNALSQVDSTCWIAYNYRASGYEPGGCYIHPTAQPAKKAASHAPACPPCGTFEMSYDCCVACGYPYIWAGGCMKMPEK